MNFVGTRIIGTVGGALALAFAAGAACAQTEADTRVVNAWLNNELDYGKTEITYDGPPIKFVYASYISAASPLEKVNVQALKLLEELSNGKLKVESYFSESLHPQREGHTAARDNVASFTACFVIYQPRMVDMLHSVQLPFMFDESPSAARTVAELYPTYYKKEIENLGVYGGRIMVTPPYKPIGNRAIRTLEDWKGTKIRAAGGTQADIVRALGAVPVNVPSVDLYTSLQRGTVDAVALNDPAVPTFKLNEISKFQSQIGIFSVNLEYCLSPTFFDGLPGDLKELVYLWMQRWNMAHAQLFYGLGVNETRKILLDSGVELIEPSKAEFDRMKAAVSGIREDFIEKNEKAGRPARQMVADMTAARDKYRAMGWNEVMEDLIRNPVRGLIDY